MRRDVDTDVLGLELAICVILSIVMCPFSSHFVVMNGVGGIETEVVTFPTLRSPSTLECKMSVPYAATTILLYLVEIKMKIVVTTTSDALARESIIS
jgi:hypothetical protein